MHRNLANNKLTGESWSHDLTGMIAIAEALKVNKTITSIKCAESECFTPLGPADAIWMYVQFAREQPG